MKTPPIDHADLVALGMDAAATIVSESGRYTVTPQPPKLVRQLIAALAGSPAPDERMPYLRHVRDLLIGLTDWTQGADAPLTLEQRDAWADYRQALRDLPQTYSGNGPIPWPEAP